MNDMMPTKDYEFIKNIQDYMLDSTNMKEDDAWDFAFRIRQSKEWLTKYLLNDARNDIAYEQGSADTIDECIDTLNNSIPLVNNTDIIFGFKCAVERLEQLKEKTEIESVIGYGSACDGCKKCIKYKSRKCRGMSVTCFGFKTDKK